MHLISEQKDQLAKEPLEATRQIISSANEVYFIEKRQARTLYKKELIYDALDLLDHLQESGYLAYSKEKSWHIDFGEEDLKAKKELRKKEVVPPARYARAVKILKRFIKKANRTQSSPIEYLERMLENYDKKVSDLKNAADEERDIAATYLKSLAKKDRKVAQILSKTKVEPYAILKTFESNRLWRMRDLLAASTVSLGAVVIGSISTALCIAAGSSYATVAIPAIVLSLWGIKYWAPQARNFFLQLKARRSIEKVYKKLSLDPTKETKVSDNLKLVSKLLVNLIKATKKPKKEQVELIKAFN